MSRTSLYHRSNMDISNFQEQEYRREASIYYNYNNEHHYCNYRFEASICDKYDEIYNKAYNEDANNWCDENDIDFIDFEWFQETVRNQDQSCSNCGCQMSFESCEWKSNILTIRKKDDLLGHIKSNCFLICNGCNVYNSSFFEPTSFVNTNNMFAVLVNK